MSGCAQWWPARMQTPSRPSSSATSCGCSAVELERDERAAALGVGRAVDLDVLDRRQALQRVGGDLLLVLAHGVHADLGQPVDRGPEPDRLGDLRRAGLELPRQLDPGGRVALDLLDHVAAADERRHLLEQLEPAVQHADPGRPVRLVAGPRVEVGVDRGQVDRDLRHRLGAVDHRERAGGAGAAHDLLDRVDRAEHVRHVHDRDELRALREQLVEVVEVEAALVVDAHVLEPRAGELPRARCSSGAPSR